MALGIERQDGEGAISVVILRGKLMLGEDCFQLEKVIPELLRDGRTKLIFDLSEVTHIDSTGIGRFIDEFPIPVGRPGKPEELAAFVAFLLGPDARFFCGSVLFCDGGTNALLRADSQPVPWT